MGELMEVLGPTMKIEPETVKVVRGEMKMGVEPNVSVGLQQFGGMEIEIISWEKS